MTTKDYAEYLKTVDNTITPSTATQIEQQEALRPVVEWIERHTPSKLYKFRECNENNINAFRNEQIWFATAQR